MLIQAINLTHSYDYPLFKDVSFSLNSSETLAIVGVSGSGKSTLMHNLATFLKPHTGEVKLLGSSVYELSEKRLNELRRYKVGIVFQSHYLFKGLSARENIDISAILSLQKVDINLLERLGIADLMEQKVTHLSGGQQQRVSIARMLSKKPKIIFADEPTGNLDAKTASEVMDVLFEYVKKEKAALILVTHDTALAKRCDSVYELKNQALAKLV